MTKITPGFLLTRQSHDTKKHPDTSVITLWVSTPEGAARLIIPDEKPLFFVRQSFEQEVASLLQKKSASFQWKSFEWKPLPLKTFAQEPVAALYFSCLRDYHEAQQLLRQAQIPFFESDIRLHERFLMERFIYGGLEFTGKKIQHTDFAEYHDVKIRPADYHPDLIVISLDVECSMQGDLYCIGIYGNTRAQGRKHNYQHVIMIGDKEDSPDWIEWVTDEKSLLHALEESIACIDPDIIIGWNIINFDCRLLLQRAALHDIPLLLGREKSPASWRDSRNDNNQGFISMAGRVVIDGIDALKTATYSFPSFSLENIAQALLGRGKKVDDVHNRADEITDNFRHHKQKLAVYNLEDCVLVWEIFQKTRVLDFLLFRTQLTGLELDKQGGSVAAFSNLYLPHLHRAGYIAPNLPTHNVMASPGGYVMDSQPGLYRNVLVLDYKSLYPSIIRTFKIDPMGLIEGLLDPDNAIAGFRGAYFSRDKHFLPEIINKLWQQRDEAKRLNDQPRSQALKIIMNSFYGVLGSGGCRFYDTRLASSITLRGHEIIQQTAQWITQLGYNVIYGDTDSLFVLLDAELDTTQAEKIAQALVQEINDNWQHKLQEELQLPCYLEIEFDTHFTRFLMPTVRGSDIGSKKRYAGLVETKTATGIKEDIIFKGLESVRTDWTDLAKEFQAQLYDCVFHDKDPVPMIMHIIGETLAGKRDHQLVYRKRLRQKLELYVKNVPPHVRAARLADEQNRLRNLPLQYQHKGWISYVMTINGPEPVEYITSPLDYNHYIEKQLQPIADAILPTIGLSFDRLANSQMGLF